MGKSKMSDKDYFEKIVKNSYSIIDALRKFGYTTPSNFYTMFHKWVEKHNCDISHFQDRSQQMRGKLLNKKYELGDIFIENFQGGINGTSLKRKLYDNGLKQPICELCGIDENWNGSKLTMILDHINGINNDNRLENLRIVCPNCDSTLPTSKGRNKKKSHPFKTKELDIKIDDRILFSNKKTDELINQIKNSGVDLTKRGYGAKLSKILNMTPQYCLKFVKLNQEKLVL